VPNRPCFFLLSVVVSFGEDVVEPSAKEVYGAPDLDMSATDPWRYSEYCGIFQSWTVLTSPHH
jgi:hypothetical protein